MALFDIRELAAIGGIGEYCGIVKILGDWTWRCVGWVLEAKYKRCSLFPLPAVPGGLRERNHFKLDNNAKVKAELDKIVQDKYRVGQRPISLDPYPRNVDIYTATTLCKTSGTKIEVKI